MANSITNIATKALIQRAGIGSPELPVNISTVERVVSLVGGGMLAAIGARSKGIFAIALPAVGACLAIRGASGHCSMYQAMGIDTSQFGSGTHGPMASVDAGSGVRVEHSVMIDKPREELYKQWRRFDQLPRFMTHLREVRILDNTRSHWVAKAPLGMSVEWDAEIHNETPNELIAWRSVGNSDIDTAGSVHFEDTGHGRGTLVRVNLKYDPPAGKAGIAIAKLFGEDAEHQIRQDLRRFKQLMEAGELATTEGQPAGR